MSGPEPRLAGRALALEGERPAVEGDRRPLRDETRGLEKLVSIRVAVGEDPLGQAVRGEDDVGIGSADAVGEDGDEGLVVVPALDEASSTSAPLSSAFSSRSR